MTPFSQLSSVSPPRCFCGLLLFLLLAANTLLAQMALGEVELQPSLQHPDVEESLADMGLETAALMDSTRVAELATALQKRLYDRGYLFAEVDTFILAPMQPAVYSLHVHGTLGDRVLFGSLDIQSDSLKKNHYNRLLSVSVNAPFNKTLLENDLNEMLKSAADSGFVFAAAEVSDVQMRREEELFADVIVRIKEGPRIVIDRVEIRGNAYTKRAVILRELPLRAGDRFSRTKSEMIPRRLERMGIFKNVKTPQLQLDGEGRPVLVLEVEEGNATTFDGVIGYIPEAGPAGQSDGFFTGLIDISFKNLFGTARAFDVHWEKSDRLSEFFSLNYTEPWVGGIPLAAQFELQRILRDSTYLEWRTGISGRYRYSENLSLLAGFSRLVVLPDSAANRDFRLLRYAQNNIEVGIEYDTRDYLLNPRGGVFYHTTYSSGFKDNFGPSYLFREDSVRQSETVETIRLQFRWYYELFRNQVLAFHFTGNSIRGDRLQLTDFFWFGGARTLRGYRENQFRGDIAAWVNLEYRFLLGRNSRLFVFNDWGAWRFPTATETIEEIKPGYGIGLRLDTGLGVLGVDFGLGEGDSFSQAKIHFGIVNRF